MQDFLREMRHRREKLKRVNQDNKGTVKSKQNALENRTQSKFSFYLWFFLFDYFSIKRKEIVGAVVVKTKKHFRKVYFTYCFCLVSLSRWQEMLSRKHVNLCCLDCSAFLHDAEPPQKLITYICF